MSKICRSLFALSFTLAGSVMTAQPAPPTPAPPTGPYAPPAIMKLTGQQAVDLALQNNLDISMQRISPQIAEESIQALRGAYDPSLSLSYQHQVSEQAHIVGDQVLPPFHSSQDQYSASLGGKIPLGTQYVFSTSLGKYLNTFVDDTGNKTTSKNVYSFAGVSIQQPLLRGFGLLANQYSIWIARKNKEQSEHEFTYQVMQIVKKVQDAYYDLVLAIDNQRVQEEALTLARTLLEENKKKVQVGVLSPLEVTQAESGVAASERDIIAARRAVLNQENQLKLLISRDVFSLRKTHIEPAEAPIVLPVPLDTEESIRQALLFRPDYLTAKLTVESAKITVQYSRNQTFPEIDLIGSYGSSAAGSAVNKSIKDVFDGKNTAWSAGLQFQYSIPNRSARAGYRTARLSALLALEQMKKAEQTIIVDVDTAVGNVESNLKGVDAARTARRLAEESLKVEQIKYNTGISTSLQVLQVQDRLTSARSAEIGAVADYNKSVSNLYLSEGTILKHNNIVVQNNR